MKAYNFTNGKKAIKTYKEVSNKFQGVYSENETIRTFQTDDIGQHQNQWHDTRFEEVKC